jgi:hypothetical protein
MSAVIRLAISVTYCMEWSETEETWRSEQFFTFLEQCQFYPQHCTFIQVALSSVFRLMARRIIVPTATAQKLSTADPPQHRSPRKFIAPPHLRNARITHRTE